MTPAEPRRAHWESVWAERATDGVSWYQARPALSLELIRATGAGPDARVIDVGGGASTLVDHLLDAGYGDVTVLDVAPEALERAKARLGERAGEVAWRAGDVTEGDVGGPYDVWHDRAVFHFLTDAADRAAYRRALAGALAPGGHVVLATFAPDGPEQCSGLPVRRYDAQGLAAELGAGFRLVQEAREVHETPWGAAQAFQYARFRRDLEGA